MENLKFRSFSLLALASVHNYFKYIQGIAWTPAAALTGTSPTHELLCCCDAEGSPQWPGIECLATSHFFLHKEMGM